MGSAAQGPVARSSRAALHHPAALCKRNIFRFFPVSAFACLLTLRLFYHAAPLKSTPYFFREKVGKKLFTGYHTPWPLFWTFVGAADRAALTVRPGCARVRCTLRYSLVFRPVRLQLLFGVWTLQISAARHHASPREPAENQPAQAFGLTGPQAGSLIKRLEPHRRQGFVRTAAVSGTR